MMLAAPLLMAHLGAESYGILLALISLIGFFSVFDLDLNSAINKFVSYHVNQGELRRAQQTIEIVLFAYLLISTTVVVILITAKGLLIDEWLSVEGHVRNETETVFTLITFNFWLSMISWVYGATINSNQRSDLLATFSFAQAFIHIGAMVYFAVQYKDVTLVALTYPVVSALTLVSFVIICKNISPAFSIVPKYHSETARQVFKFSLVTFLGKLATQIAKRGDRLIIAAYLSPSLVAYYAVALIPLAISWQATVLVQKVTLPAFTELRVSSSTQITKATQLATRYMYVLQGAILVVFVVGGEQFLTLWMGEEFAKRCYIVLVVFSIAEFISGCFAVMETVMHSLSKPWLPTLLRITTAGLSLILYFLLIPSGGIDGAAFAYLIPLVLLVPICIHQINKFLAISSFRFFISIVLPLTMSVSISIAAGFWISSQLATVSWISLIAAVGLSQFAYAIVLFCTRLLTWDDVVLIISALKKPSKQIIV